MNLERFESGKDAVRFVFSNLKALYEYPDSYDAE